jgi:hypothetical protein
MSLHDLFNAIVDYRVTDQDVLSVGVGIALLLVAAFVWAILLAAANELSGEGKKRRKARREYEAKRAAKAERDQIARQEWLAKDNQRRLDRKELDNLRAKGIAIPQLTPAEYARKNALEEKFGEAPWQLRAAGFDPYGR